MNLEERVAALEKKLERVMDRNANLRFRLSLLSQWVYANVYKGPKDPDEVLTDPVEEEEPLVIHGQGEYAKKIYPSDLK
tara:strand:+ start:1400 stop:1636 length:237 start_codon:yes stop_codon:yes gene_type:complete